MFFSEYQKLKPDIKILATSFWVLELLLITNAENRNQLPKVIEKYLGIKGYGELKQDQDYFYNKWKGIQHKTSAEIDRINNKIKGSSRAIYHPLWSLLSKDELTNDILLALASRLPPKIQKVLLDENGIEIISPIEQVKNMHSFDALLALLIFHHWQLINSVEYKSDELNYILLKILLRLCSFSLIKWPFQYELYALVRNIFIKDKCLKLIRNVSLKCFPVALSQITNPRNLKVAVYHYQNIAEKLTLSDKIEPSDQNKLDYLALIEHQNLFDLSKDLEKNISITSNINNTVHDRLRHCFKFRAPLPILLPRFHRFMESSTM